MDAASFDRWSLHVATAASRRTFGGVLLGSLLALRGADPAGAACKQRGKPCGTGKGNKGKAKSKGRCCKGLHCCDGRCRRTAADPNHCGPACRECRNDQTCVAGKCTPHCQDGKRNFDETDRDCGGSCGKCGLGQRCRRDTDCVPATFSGVGVCADRGTGLECVQCRLDSQCNVTPLNPFCVNHFCTECRGTPDCVSAPGRPVCVNGICQQCGQSSDCPPGQTCLPSQLMCSDSECLSGADCASGCCSGGRCVTSFADDPFNCGACGNGCPGQFPQCVMCCSGTCQNPPRGAPPGNECVCP